MANLAAIATRDRRIAELTASLGEMLDMVDYTRRACGLTDMVSAALPADTLKRAQAALRGGEESK